MAVIDAYATVENYRAVISKSDAGEDAEILTDLTAISRYLDKKLSRFFTKDVAAVTRTYTPGPAGVARPGWAEAENPYAAGGLQRVLYIDDLVVLTSIKIDEDHDGSFADETALVASDYQLQPLNAAVGSEPRPYTGIELTEWGTKNAFTPGTQVEVSATWGWPAVPQAIERATIHFAAILRLESPRATRRIAEGFEGAIETSRNAQDIISELEKHYKRVRL
jgi:hypothetical protein